MVVWGRPADGSNTSKDGGGPTGVRRGAKACRRIGPLKPLLAVAAALIALLLFAGSAAAAAPETTITSDPGAATKDTTPRFKFTSDTPGSTFECRVDVGAWTSCSSPYDLPTQSNGAHTFEVRATNASLETDTTPASFAFFVDNVRPTTQLTNQPASSLLDYSNPTFEFTGNDAAPSSGAVTFECKLDSDPYAACTSPFSPTLADGAHSFRVRAVDPAGNVDASPATFLNFTIDTVAPTLSVTTVPDLISDDPTPGFDFTASDASPSSGLQTKCRVDAGSWSNCSSPFAPALADGVHTVEIKAVDGVGNEDGGNFSYTFRVDTVAPDTDITNLPGSHLLDHSPSFDFSGTDAAPSSGIFSYECRIDGGSWDPCASPWSAPFSDGVHSFEVRAIDSRRQRRREPCAVPQLHGRHGRAEHLDHLAPAAVLERHEPELRLQRLRSRSLQRAQLHVPARRRLLVRVLEPRVDLRARGQPHLRRQGRRWRRQRGPDARELLVDGRYHRPRHHAQPPAQQGALPAPPQQRRLQLQRSAARWAAPGPLRASPPAPTTASTTRTSAPTTSSSPPPTGPATPTTKKVAYVIDPPDYGKFVEEDHPLAYYRFNEALGSDQMNDSSGHGHDGTYQNGIALQRDGATNCERRPHPPRVCELANPAENRAAYFPARDGHGYVNGISAPTHAYTMEAWVKPRDGADMMILGHGGGGQLFISGGHLAFRQTQDTIVRRPGRP